LQHLHQFHGQDDLRVDPTAWICKWISVRGAALQRSLRTDSQSPSVRTWMALQRPSGILGGAQNSVMTSVFTQAIIAGLPVHLPSVCTDTCAYPFYAYFDQQAPGRIHQTENLISRS